MSDVEQQIVEYLEIACILWLCLFGVVSNPFGIVVVFFAGYRLADALDTGQVTR